MLMSGTGKHNVTKFVLADSNLLACLLGLFSDRLIYLQYQKPVKGFF